MVETAKRREIAVTKEDRAFLMKLFGVTNQTIYNALDLDKEPTYVRSRIRKAALERGGVVMVTLPEMETIHTADGRMIQRFGNGAVLTFYRADGHGELWHKGKLISSHRHVGVMDIFALQDLARNLK
ncbi:MAG: hypothetical protein K2N05_05650 [Muribaculaceae bacterium]|nr:hypothetical protein [Muribaculaceae bacterium]